MQAASNEYKDMMRRKWRNPLSYLRVTIGLINQQAQASAYIPERDVYTYYSDLVKPMDNYMQPVTRTIPRWMAACISFPKMQQTWCSIRES